MGCLLGIDIGTSGAKTLLMSADGVIFGTVVSNYDIVSSKPNWAEEDPLVWWEAVKWCLARLREDHPREFADIKAVGLSGQMHGAVFVDRQGNPLYPCILWADNRTVEECREITEKIGAERMGEITGNPVTPAYTAPKVLWFKKNHPDLYRQTHRILMSKDYLGWRLTGRYYTDYSDASGTLLLDIKRKRWSEEIFSLLGLDPDKHPEIRHSHEIIGGLRREAAEELGLSPGLPVTAGGGDLACGLVGSGNIREGIATVTIGTAGQVMTTVERIPGGFIGRLHNFCHAEAGKYFTLAAVLSAGLSLKWFKNNVSLVENLVATETRLDPFDLLLEGVEEVPPGADGLLFLPYLNGCGTPFMDPKARGAFIGLTARHTKKEMVRAIIEGISFGIKDCLDVTAQAGIPLDKVIIAAGGAKNLKWQQIQADIYATDVCLLEAADISPFGAAILAAYGLELFANLETACNYYVLIRKEIRPITKNSQIYQRYYAIYKKLYPSNKEIYHEIFNQSNDIKEDNNETCC